MEQTFVGIDVAKDRLDVHVRPAEERRAARSLESAIKDAPLGRDATLLDPTLKPWEMPQRNSRVRKGGI